MATQTKLYMILTNPKGEKCIFLTPEKISTTTPNSPEILYNGKEHALLYRSPNQTLLLDYIAPPEREIIYNLKEILVVEFDISNNKIAHEYMAKITQTKEIPDIQTDLVEKLQK
jgi:hypothetical protein